MKKNLKIVGSIVAFAAFLLVVVLMYNYLSDKYKAKNPISEGPGVTSSAPAASSSAPESSSAEPAPGSAAPAASSSGTPAASEKPKIEAPDFTAVDEAGNTVKLSDYKGTPVVLNFWASWCPPCKSEMPEFNKVSEEYKSDQLVFLMLNMTDGQRETVDTATKYVQDNKYTFKVLYDIKQEAAYNYGIQSIPDTLFIDKDGYVQAGVQGAIDEATLRKGIDLIYSSK